MTFTDDFRRNFHTFSTAHGRAITFIDSFTLSFSGAGYDGQFLSSGTSASAQIMDMPLNKNDIELFVKQGIIAPDDKKVYMHGSVTLTGDAVFVVAGSRFSVVGDIQQWPVSGVNIYQRVFLRMWNGSPQEYI